MSRKSRALDFKKGDKVVFLDDNHERIVVEQGVVFLVRQNMPVKRWDDKVFHLTVVYVEYVSCYGHRFTRKFAEEFGKFQQDPYPLWRLRHINGDEFANLKKRSTRARKLYDAYREEIRRIDIQVESEAREWKNRRRDELEKAIPHGQKFLENVVARMGFKRPKN